MGRTTRTQVALYLDDEKIGALAELAHRFNRTQQSLLREAVDDLLVKHAIQVSVADEARLADEQSTQLAVGPKVSSGANGRKRPQRERYERPGRWHQDPAQPTRQIHDVDRVAGTKTHEVRDAKTGARRLRKVERLKDAKGRGSAKPRSKPE